jgi:hypothetical protein
MVGIVLTLVAVLLVIVLAFCNSDDEVSRGERMTDTLVRAAFRNSKNRR